MRHIINVVSVGMFLGLSLLAITILAALYATPWQAATILAVITGSAVAVSIYFGGCANCERTQRAMQEVRDTAAREIQAIRDEAEREVRNASQTLHKREEEIAKAIALTEHERLALKGLLEGILCRKAQVEAAQRAEAQRAAALPKPAEVLVVREIIIIDDQRRR